LFWRSRKRRRFSKKAGGYGLFFWRDPFWEPRVWLRRMVRIAVMLLLLSVTVPPAVVLLYRDFAPPGTLLMVFRLFEGEGIKKEWVSLEKVSRHVPAAVIALEDNLFCEHNGFDWAAIFEAAADQARGEGALRGGSTISQQTSKNVFLWPGRTFIRKGMEVPFTFMIEWAWDKRRIMEVYLNVVEWGPGIYGVEAAAQSYFGKSASRLTRREAALLAAILPNPRRWSAATPTPYINGRARTAMARMRSLGTLTACVR
jgi:monofunctional biosynthetic peptidoglycan transglycosylase